VARPPVIAEVEWEGIRRRYAAGVPVADLAASFGVGREAIYRIIRRGGLAVQRRGGSSPIDDATCSQICEMYTQKRGATSIARALGVDKATVYNVLHRAGVGTRPRSDRCGDTYHCPPGRLRPRGRERKGHLRGPRGAFNADAFSVLDDETCYWAGYLITDGSIGAYDGRSYRLTLNQARKHREQCEKLAVYLGTEIEVKDFARVTFGKLRLFSRLSVTLPLAVAQRLLALGIRPAKTAVARPSGLLATRPAFWRGVIDGDGSVLVGHLIMNSSSPRMAGAFRRFARLRGSRPLVYRNHAGVWALHVCRRSEVQPLLRALYPAGCAALTGKAKRAEQSLGLPPVPQKESTPRNPGG
jgi:hypothetical protein